MKKILAIDDIEDNLVVLKALIHEAFPTIEFYSALSGMDGIDLCQFEKPDIVLLDILMPVMDGFEVCRILKSNDMLKHIPVVMITAAGNSRELRIKALESGADAFLAKPVDLPEIIAQIRAMLRIKEAEDQKILEKQLLEDMVRQRTDALEKELEQRKKAEQKLQFAFDELDKVFFRDVIERNKVEESIRKAEKYYRSLIERATDGIVLIGKDDRITYASPAAKRMFGYDKDADNFPEPVASTHPDDLPAVLDSLQKVINDPSYVPILEYRFKRNNGEWLWVESTCSNLLTESGIEAIVINFRDISERKRAEDILRENEKRFRVIFENVPIGMFQSSVEGKLIFVNPAFADMFGYDSPEECLEIVNKSSVADVLYNDPERRPVYLNKIELSENKWEIFENRYHRKDGSVFDGVLSFGKRQETISGDLYLYGFVQDITHKTKIEETQQFLNSAGWTNSEEDFFQSLCRFLSGTLGMEYVCIDLLLPEKQEFQTIVNFAQNTFANELCYKAEGTPCGEVVGKSVVCYERDVTDLFPTDAYLRELDAESYAGATLWSSKGKPLGIIALIGKQPIENRSMVESVLNLVSLRAAGELERREAEMALLKSRMAFQNYFENCSVGMSVTLPDKKWLEVNQSLCQMLGYSKEELLQLTWVRVTHPDDVERNMALFNEMVTGSLNGYELDKRFVRKDGSILYSTLSVVCERNPNGSVNHLLSSYVDVTARRLAEEEIKRERTLLRTLIDNLPNTVYVKDIEARKIVSNKSDLAHMGRTSEAEVFGKTDIELFSGEDGIRGYQEDLTVIQTGTQLINQQSTLYDSRGVQHWQLNSKFPLYDENQNVQGLVGIGYDITERKLIEDALKSSEELYRNLVERMPDGVYKSTPAGKFVSVNSAMVKLFGYDSKEEFMSIDIKNDLYFEPEERASDVLDEIGQGIEVYKLKRKDGSEIWVEDHGWYIFDDQGDIVFHEGILRDVSERRKADEKLRSLSRAVEQNPASIIITDTIGQIEYVNKNFTQQTGYSYDEVLGKNPNLLKSGFTPSSEYNILWQTILQGKEWHGEFRNRKKNGEEYFEEVTISPIKDEHGQITNFLAVKMDITGQKKDQTLIRKLSKAIEQSPVSTIITDAHGKIEFVNTAFSTLTQYTLDEVVNKPPRIFNESHISENDFKTMWTNLLEGKVWKGEFLNRRKDNVTYWENVTISPLTDSNGAISNYILIMDDISEKKAMFNQLIAAKNNAEESNRLKSAFLATMNHELRTPLHHIIGFSELIMSDVSPEENSIFAQGIHSSGLSLLSIIEDIFDLALFEQANVRIRSHTFSIIDHFMECKSSFDNILRASSKHEQIQLVFKPETHWLSGYVTTDRSKINQVLTNLFKNAVKFTEKGTIEFGYKIDDESNMIFFVTDTGIGIPKEKQSIIFDFFRQGDDDIKRVHGGIGIGLAISQKIAKILNGELTVVSEPNIGSTFYLKVPVELSDISPDIKI